MIKNKMVLVAYLYMSSSISMVMAMQPLDDQSLSTTTGQDGINIGISTNKIDFDQISLIDTDGINSQIAGKDYTNKAALTVAGNNNAPVSVSFVGASSAPSVSLSIDTDGGNGKAFANIGLSLGNNISGIKVSPFSLYLASSGSVSSKTSQQSIFSSVGTLNGDVSKLLEIGSASNNFEINFNNTNKPQVNIQLGNVPQSHMIQFSGAIQAICGTGSGCPITVVSGDTGAKFDFQMKGTDNTNGFVLNGLYAGVEQNGLVIGHAENTSKMNVALNNVMMGRDGAVSPTVFNGLSNGSMGSFGVVGASVKDLKVNIRGL